MGRPRSNLVISRGGWALHDGHFPEMAAMTNTRKILIVDDDAELRDAMVEQLTLHEEFESVAVDSGSKGVQAAKSDQVDLVIMDVGLPDLDGREAVRILRKNGFKAPIIMLTGHNTDSDTILGLESGANDYVAKPFRFAVLLARIRAQLRQHEASEDAVFTIGPYTFQPRSKILLNQKGNKVRLTEKETLQNARRKKLIVGYKSWILPAMNGCSPNQQPRKGIAHEALLRPRRLLHGAAHRGSRSRTHLRSRAG